PVASEDSPSILALVLDVNPWYWGARKLEMEEKMQDEKEESAELISFSEMMEHLLVFLNSFLALNESNLLTIIASHPTHTNYVYPPNDAKDSTGSTRALLHNNFGRLREGFWTTLFNLLEQSTKTDTQNEVQPSNISGAIALAMCCTLACNS